MRRSPLPTYQEQEIKNVYEMGSGMEKTAETWTNTLEVLLKGLEAEAETTEGYAGALRLIEALAAKVELVETARDGKPGKETAEALATVAWSALLARRIPQSLGGRRSRPSAPSAQLSNRRQPGTRTHVHGARRRTIALCATFEHLRVDPFFALEEMRRVLQPDGLLYLTTPNLYRLGNVVSFALGRGLAFDPIREYGKLRTVGHMGHVREYTASEIRRFLAGAGFARVEVGTRATPSRRGTLVDAVHRLLPRIRSELVVTARPGPNSTSNA